MYSRIIIQLTNNKYGKYIKYDSDNTYCYYVSYEKKCRCDLRFLKIRIDKKLDSSFIKFEDYIIDDDSDYKIEP